MLLAALLAVTIGCRADAPRLLVVVAAESSLPSVHALRTTVNGVTQTLALPAGGASLPLSFAVVPARPTADTLAAIQIDAVGDADTVLAVGRQVVHLTQGASGTRRIVIVLRASCAGISCTASGDAGCRADACCPGEVAWGALETVATSHELEGIDAARRPNADCATADSGDAGFDADDARDCGAVIPPPVEAGVGCPATEVVHEVSIGGSHTCVVLGRGDAGKQVWCWGENYSGQLGDGEASQDDFVPPRRALLPPTEQPNQVVAGARQTCALTASGHVYCWGSNESELLIPGEPSPSVGTPHRVDSLSEVTGLTAGGGFFCAVLMDQTVRCWGQNDVGQLGGSNGDGGVGPVTVPGLTGVTQVTAGSSHACAIARDRVVCWGQNRVGELGRGTTSAFESPGPVVLPENAPATVVSAAPGGAFTCALDFPRSRLICWGANDQNQLSGAPDAGPFESSPRVVGTSELVSFSVGSDFLCTAASDASGVCWGNNASGQFGNGTMTAAPDARGTPAPIGKRDSQFASGYRVTCRWNLSEGLQCTGSNGAGHLGLGVGESCLPFSTAFRCVQGLPLR